MADNVKVADAYVPVKIKDETRPGLMELARNLQAIKPKKIPVEVQLVSDALGREMGYLGRKYAKQAFESGSFAGEALGKGAAKSMSAMITHPYVMLPIRTGMVAGFTAMAPLAAAAFVTKFAYGLQTANNAPLASYGEMIGKQITESMVEATAPMVPHFTKAMQSIGNAARQYAPEARQAFGAFGTMLDDAVVAASRFAEHAMPGVMRAVTTARPLTLALADAAVDAGEGFTRFGIAASAGFVDTGTNIRAFGKITSDVGNLIGHLTTEISGFFAGVSGPFTGVVDSLSNIIIGLASHAMPMLTTAGQITTSVFGMMLDILEPLSGVMGTVMGTFLSGTIIVRGLSGTIGILTSAFSLLSGAALKSSLTTFATQAGNAALSAGVLTERLTGSAAAGDKVMSAGAKITSAMSKVASTLPLVGTAIVALTVAYDTFGTKATEVSQKVLNGSMTLQEAINAERNQIEMNNIQWLGGISAKEEDALARQNVTAKIREQMAAMDPLSRAVANVSLQEGIYRDALRDTGPESDRTKEAAARLAQARRDEEAATFASKQATKDHTQALIDNQNQIMGMLNADLAYRQAMYERQKAQAEVTRLTREGKGATDEMKEAQFRLEGADIRVAEAHGRLARENGGLRSETDKATLAANAERESILRVASAADGSGSPAIRKQAAEMSNEAIQANNAAVKTSGLAYEVRSLPDGRQVLISTPGLAEATKGVSNLGVQIQRIPGRNVDIFVSSTGKGGIASAGRLATGGILPGYTPGRDVHVASSPFGPIELSGGEAVMRPEWTRAIGPGWINAANAAARAGGIQGVRRFMGMSQGEGKSGDSAAPLAFAAGGITPVNAKFQYRHTGPTVSQLWDQAAQDYIRRMGGRGLSWARTQAGKPYVWGGVGPRGYDCSGFMSAITNVIQNRPIHQRRGATGNFPWPGFKGGYGPFTIGSTANAGGGIGHMAGTIAGTNVESRGGQGVVVGSSARGASNGLFRTRAHLAFDDGGLATGVGILPKRIAEPERVLNPRQTQAFEAALDNNFENGPRVNIENLVVNVRGILDPKDPGSARELAVLVSDEIRKVERSRS